MLPAFCRRARPIFPLFWFARRTSISTRTLSTAQAYRFEETRRPRKYEPIWQSSLPASQPSRQLFVWNIPFDARDADVHQVFARFGRIESVNLAVNKHGLPQGSGHVIFMEPEAATAALTADITLRGRDLRTDYAHFPKRTALRPPQAPSRVLFAGNMPFGVHYNYVREMFAPFGRIKSVRLNMRSRSFAYIEFERQDDAVAACEFFAKEPLYMGDRKVRVNYAPALDRG
ncbi:hypothetical protein C8R43DRAFT_661826 [Mycena crocata]|nr:hypothetical protein C8R43DRAFT_661826 [Mycena crocata]